MFLIGCDFHPSWQQVSWLEESTGEGGDRELVHAPGAAEEFYRQFAASARVGIRVRNVIYGSC